MTQRWVAPFFMASFNTRIVRRSNALTNWSYGREFRYDEVMDTGRGPMGAVKAGLTSAVLGGLFAGMSTAPTRSVLDRVLPKPGEGPSEESMAKGRFVFEIVTTTTTGADYRTKVAAPYDPGYSGTAIMLGQTGLALGPRRTALSRRSAHSLGRAGRRAGDPAGGVRLRVHDQAPMTLVGSVRRRADLLAYVPLAVDHDRRRRDRAGPAPTW